MTERSRPAQVKLVLLGEAAVGKSSLCLRFVQSDFQENKEPTIGAAFLTQKCQVDNRTIKFEIWDTAGQERFHSLAPMYYRNAQAAIVVYDITKASSLDKAKAWVKELQRQASQSIVICLAGNKADLVEDAASVVDDEDDSSPRREIPYEDGKAYADELGLLFFETSAKTGSGVQDVFESIARGIPEEALPGRTGGLNGRDERVELNDRSNEGAKQSGCAC